MTKRIVAPILWLWGIPYGWYLWYRKAEEAHKLQAWYTFFMFLTVLIMVASFRSTSRSSSETASLQQRSVDLNTRPYLSLRIVNLTWRDFPQDASIGPEVVYTNLGKIPASKIETKFFITTDKDGNNRGLEKYALETWGGYKQVVFLAPGETDAVSRHLSLSPSTEIYYISIVASYEGIDEGKRYWTQLTKAFRVMQIGRKRIFNEIDSGGNWDRNANYSIPELRSPNFANYAPKSSE